MRPRSCACWQEAAGAPAQQPAGGVVDGIALAGDGEAGEMGGGKQSDQPDGYLRLSSLFAGGGVAGRSGTLGTCSVRERR